MLHLGNRNTYVTETWTVTVATAKRIESLELWLYQRFMKITWIQQQKDSAAFKKGTTTLPMIDR